MMAFENLAQQKIQEAIEAGEFDNLPNAREKLDLDGYFALPAHLRMARLRVNVALDRLRADARRRI